MVRGKETAEERLLRMIEGPQPAQAGGRGRAPFSLGSGGLGSFFSGWRGWFNRSGRYRREDPVLRNLRLISQGGWLVLALIGGYVIFNLIFVDVESRRPAPPKPVASGTEASGGSAKPLNQLALPLADYVSSVMQHNPFTGSSENIAKTPDAAPVQSAKDRLEAIASKFKVVGIDRGPSPEALIEDTGQNRTHFVKEGDLLNGLRVEEISARGVRVSYEGEEMLLN